MKKITLLNKVNNFNIFKDNIIIWKSDEIYHNDKCIFTGKIYNYRIFKNSLLVEFEENIAYYYHIETQTKKLLSYVGDFLNEDIILEGKWNESYTERLIFANNIKNDSILWESYRAFFLNLSNKNHFYSVGNNEVTKNDLSTATSSWQFDLGSLGTYFETFHQQEKRYEVQKFLGVWQDELLVACSNGLILCLNIATGKETRRFHQCLEYQLGSHTNTSLDSSDVFQLQETANKLIALYAYFYMEIDLGTSEISIYPLDDVMKKNNLSFFRRSLGYALDGELIYTIGEVANHNSPISKGDRCILAFDANTKDVVWQYVFEGDSVNTDIPQYANNKLYQLTSSNTLFIFEKV